MQIRQPREMLADRMIVKHLSGSKAYGTNTPSSDTDIRGIFCADDIYNKSPWHNVKEISVPEEEDTKYYELSNFMRLLVDQSPNIVEGLWIDESSILFTSPAYEYLRSRRQELLSTKIAFTFSGYAMSQMKRIKGHNKWINNPQPAEPPRQIDYIKLVQDFSTDKFFKFTGANMVEHCDDLMFVPYGNNLFGMYPSCDGRSLYSPDYTLNTTYEGAVDGLGLPIRIVKFNIEEYKLKKRAHKQYWDWHSSRNKVRAGLEAEHGYDTKHAMHLVRLLRMGREILTTGEVAIMRPDAEELLDIRDGKWTYDELISYAENLDNRIRDVYYRDSALRRRVNIETATEILFATQKIVDQQRIAE